MLTDTQIKNLKAVDKPRKYADGGGLFLYVTVKGSKLWRLTYRYNNKWKLISFGEYPTVSLKTARKRRDEAKKLLSDGIDPSRHRKAEKASKLAKEANLFKNIALEWHQTQTGHLTSENYRNRLLQRMELHLFPYLGKMPITMIEPQDLLAAVRIVEKNDNLILAKKLVEMTGRIFRYAVATGRTKHNIAADLRGALATHQVVHRAAITDARKIGELLLRIDSYVGIFPVQCALKLLPLVFVRSSELSKAEWQEIDFEKEEWRIPPQRMKMKEIHIVPLAKQTVEILLSLQKFSGNFKYLFPSIRSFERHLSHTTLISAVRNMGYGKDEHCVHGFRGMASTMLNELGYNRDWIERQLAHSERNGVRAAYNYAQYLPERRRMMQEWADYLDILREKARQEMGNV